MQKKTKFSSSYFARTSKRSNTHSSSIRWHLFDRNCHTSRFENAFLIFSPPSFKRVSQAPINATCLALIQLPLPILPDNPKNLTQTPAPPDQDPPDPAPSSFFSPPPPPPPGPASPQQNHPHSQQPLLSLLLNPPRRLRISTSHLDSHSHSASSSDPTTPPKRHSHAKKTDRLVAGAARAAASWRTGSRWTPPGRTTCSRPGRGGWRSGSCGLRSRMLSGCFTRKEKKNGECEVGTKREVEFGRIV